ncbi:MAG: aldolase [Oscillospiraceae bacterium]|nr:aldolase [Oscillospiraceae bacterium]
MPLKLMYITNRQDVAKIAQKNGVDRIFVDMEYLGKNERQPGDTVKSSHTIKDVENIRSVLTDSELLVRVNPITDKSADFCGSQEEIEKTLQAGADIIMLPMAKTVHELEKFVKLVDGRAKTMFLLETKQASENIDDMLNVDGIDQIHIGLNDLHLAYGKKFMFELLVDGTVEKLCEKIRAKKIPYGFGGIARIGFGTLPSEYVIAEHYRLGSQSAILSRSFCDIYKINDNEKIGDLFEKGMKDIRKFEQSLENYTPQQFEENRKETQRLVNKICRGIGE